MSNRPERVAERIKREAADLLESTVRDPRIGMVSVTDVEVTHDLSMARVYVSVLEQGEAREQAMEALQSAAGFVRRQLASRLGLREVPELRFVLDTSIERGARGVSAPVSRILWSVQAGVVVMLAGAGLWLARTHVFDELSQLLYIVSLLAVSLGFGFVLSALASYALSRRLGLLEPASRSTHA